MNPKGTYSGGNTSGNILAQKWFADRKGRVIISFDRSCNFSDSTAKPSIGFFRDSKLKKVTHRFDIVDIASDFEFVDYLEKQKLPWQKEYLPLWRYDLYNEALSKPIKNRTWFLISKIRRLKDAQELDYFKKKACVSFVYSEFGSELEWFDVAEDPDSFIEEIVFRSLRSEAPFSEYDLELIIWAWLVKNGVEELREQVPTAHGLRRIDMLARLPEFGYLVIELKIEEATLDDLNNQLKPYMLDVQKEYGIEKLKGVLIARKESKELHDELQKPENKEIVGFVPFKFMFNIGTKKKESLYNLIDWE